MCIRDRMNGGVDEYQDLGWSRIVGGSIKGDTSGYNSVLSSKSTIGEGCYLEVSYVHGNSRVGDHCVLSYIDVFDREIPDNVVLHGLKPVSYTHLYGKRKENIIFNNAGNGDNAICKVFRVN